MDLFHARQRLASSPAGNYLSPPGTNAICLNAALDSGGFGLHSKTECIYYATCDHLLSDWQVVYMLISPACSVIKDSVIHTHSAFNLGTFGFSDGREIPSVNLF